MLPATGQHFVDRFVCDCCCYQRPKEKTGLELRESFLRPQLHVYCKYYEMLIPAIAAPTAPAALTVPAAPTFLPGNLLMQHDKRAPSMKFDSLCLQLHTTAAEGINNIFSEIKPNELLFSTAFLS